MRVRQPEYTPHLFDPRAMGRASFDSNDIPAFVLFDGHRRFPAISKRDVDETGQEVPFFRVRVLVCLSRLHAERQVSLVAFIRAEECEPSRQAGNGSRYNRGNPVSHFFCGMIVPRKSLKLKITASQQSPDSGRAVITENMDGSSLEKPTTSPGGGPAPSGLPAPTGSASPYSTFAGGPHPRPSPWPTPLRITAGE